MTPRPQSHYLECPKCESCFKVAKDVTSVPAHKCWAAEKEVVLVAPTDPVVVIDANASTSLCDGELSWCSDSDCGAAPFVLRDLSILQGAAGLCEFETRPTGCRLTCGDVSVGCSLRPHGSGVDSLCTLSSGGQFTVHHDACRG